MGGKMNKNVVFSLLIAVVLSLTYNNCTKMEFSELSELEVYQQNTDFINASCKNLLKHTKTKAVSFSKSTNECNWSVSPLIEEYF